MFQLNLLSSLYDQLVNKPRLVILDEATSALDLVAEEKMYNLLIQMSEDRPVTYVSVGHRPSLLSFHKKKLRLNGDSNHQLSDIDNANTVERKAGAGVSNM